MAENWRDIHTDENQKAINDNLEFLSYDFEKMYCNKILTDVTLKVENKVFHSHKLILSTRSPVFRAMFEQDMLENQTGVVHLTDVDENVFAIFLKYIYTGYCDSEQLHDETALKLLLTAEKYQVDCLKKHCSAYLREVLTERNACDILNVADMVSDENLRGFAMDYMKRHADKVLISESWKHLLKNNPSLAAEALSILSADIYALTRNGSKTSNQEFIPQSHSSEPRKKNKENVRNAKKKSGISDKDSHSSATDYSSLPRNDVGNTNHDNSKMFNCIIIFVTLLLLLQFLTVEVIFFIVISGVFYFQYYYVKDILTTSR